VQNAARVTYREILERRAQENGIDFINGVATGLTPMAFYETVMVKGYETLLDPDAKVDVTTGMIAAGRLQALIESRASGTGMADMLVQINLVINAVKSTVPENAGRSVFKLAGPMWRPRDRRAALVAEHGLDGPAARLRVRAQAPDADPEDLLLFDDLLGIADPEVLLPTIDPDARRRRLTALLNAASLARKTPAVYVVEDARWIDEVSESMLAEFLTVIPQTPSLVLISYRPEYRGALTRVAGALTIALAPLSDPETAALVSQLWAPTPRSRWPYDPHTGIYIPSAPKTWKGMLPT
jgi:hypothetical protein